MPNIASPIPITAAEAPAPRRSESGKGILLMALGMFMFSAVDTGAKFLTDGLHPFQIVWTRQLGLLAGAVFLIALNGSAILRTAHPKLQVLRGAVAAGSASLFIFAVSYVPLADAVAISFVAPFMVTLMGALVLREPVGIRRWAAVILGFVGALIVIRPGMGVVHPAAGLVILAAFFFAIRQIVSRALSDTDKTGTTVVYTALVGSAILTLPLPFVWQWPDGQQMIILVGIAAVAGVAEVCVIKALELAMAVVIAPVHYTLMIWGTFYGFIVFGQLPDIWTWTGAAIIFVGGVYTLRREYVVSRRSAEDAEI
ncbi:MAG: DMT family transporter [Boseongicola sp.]